ncbi:hypothetical protein AB4Y45_34130 [Paraburkholderia sp. EG287A]|uniref:hypothetical protein n=1 Tax=Paraburkholderia sp. EG287A TaxID=3237012 RepID=UPI0034D2740F
MQLTTMGSAPARISTLGITDLVPQQQTENALVPVALTLPKNFPMTLTAEQVSDVSARVAAFDLNTMRLAEIVTLSMGPTNALQKVLNGFLDRITQAENPQIFHLVDAISEAVEAEKLDQLADEIFNAKPGLKDRIIGLFSKKALRKALDRVQEDLARTTKLRSKSLREKLETMRRDVESQATVLTAEVNAMDHLVDEYRTALVDFAMEVAFLHSVLAKSKAVAPALLAAPGMDPVAKQNHQDKLQALESVVLAREGSMTKIPAETLDIREVQNAGVSTLQELTTTLGDRFLSISETLIAINSAQQVQAVQRLGESGAALDNNLTQVRARLSRQVVEKAANAPGDNRLAQANQVKSIVENTKVLREIKETARAKNEAKFAEASATFAQMRVVLLELGQQSNPAAAVAVKLN